MYKVTEWIVLPPYCWANSTSWCSWKEPVFGTALGYGPIYAFTSRCCFPPWEKFYCLLAMFHVHNWFHQIIIISYKFQTRYFLSLQTWWCVEPAFWWFRAAFTSSELSNGGTATGCVITSVTLEDVSDQCFSVLLYFLLYFKSPL